MENTTMYTIGQIARLIWPAGIVPTGMLNKLLSSPLSGIAMAIRSPAGKRVDQQAIAPLMARIPADLSDPPGGVLIEQQSDFWMGFYHMAAAIDRSRRLGPAELEAAGKLLFGERWKADLAEALDVDDRRIREWLAGTRRPRPGVWADIASLLRQRGAAQLAFLKQLDSAQQADDAEAFEPVNMTGEGPDLSQIVLDERD